MSLKRKSILIVDADAFLAGLYARRFEARRWGVRVAENAADARKAMARKAFQVMLIDVDNVESGWDVLGEALTQPRTANMVSVVLTKLGDRESIAKALEMGADGYLLKGHFVPSEVEEKVERLVAASGEMG
jgi:two-component system chemotaxis sensor kinase CheA